MLVSNYTLFVRNSDQSARMPSDQRRDIAIYGLVSEIGSLLSAVKKELLVEAGERSHAVAVDEVKEELGDAMWYCFSVSQIDTLHKPVDIFAENIEHLTKELSSGQPEPGLFRQALSAEKLNEFLDRSTQFREQQESRCFNDYQRLAFLTARTKGNVLLRVCLSVLWQLAAELMRERFPESERIINRAVDNKPINQILGEIAWHLAAVATVYGLQLDRVAHENVEKISFRTNRNIKTERHDRLAPPTQQFPSKMIVSFLTVGKGRSRMYVDGEQLGDDLTDNAYDPDGYRFHDVLHLANAVHLGWSPVLRRLMQRKRKYDEKIDEIEDGARASIVEEAVVKTIHSEGTKHATNGQSGTAKESLRLFRRRQDISFSFLKFIRNLVYGLEVHKNKYWEWEDAIFDAYRVFQQLVEYEQGTVILDFQQRSIDFLPTVHVDLKGMIACMGSAIVDLGEFTGDTRDRLNEFLSDSEVAAFDGDKIVHQAATSIAVKRAIFSAVGQHQPTKAQYHQLELSLMRNGQISLKTQGEVRSLLWDRKIISFKNTVTIYNGIANCSTIGVSDPKDK